MRHFVRDTEKMDWMVAPSLMTETLEMFERVHQDVQAELDVMIRTYSAMMAL